MLRQYLTSPFQGGENPLRVGTIATGSIYHLPENRIRPGRMRPATRPWIVEGFLNGVYSAAGRDPVTGKWFDRVISGRSDIAILRCLSNGRHRTLAVSYLRAMEESGDGADPENRYPPLPDLRRFYRATAGRQAT